MPFVTSTLTAMWKHGEDFESAMQLNGIDFGSPLTTTHWRTLQ